MKLKKVKRLVALTLSAVMLFSMAGCGKETTPDNGDAGTEKSASADVGGG